MPVGAMLMSLSTIVVALNAQVLRRLISVPTPSFPQTWRTSRMCVRFLSVGFRRVWDMTSSVADLPDLASDDDGDPVLAWLTETLHGLAGVTGNTRATPPSMTPSGSTGSPPWNG